MVHSHIKKHNDSVCRMIFFLSVFTVSSLIVYFTFGHIYGYGITLVDGVIRNQKELLPPPISRLFRRSIDYSDNNNDDFEFMIIVFGWRREKSLKRLMNSLLKAEYMNYRVKLQFHIDFKPTTEVKNYVETFEWPFGEKSVILREKTFGLMNAVAKAWSAQNDKEFVFFFEDDIEVHSRYFEYTLEIMKNNPEMLKKDSDYVGISLTTPRYDEINLDHSIWMPETNGNKLILFQQPCSWGALYFPWKWREFLTYFRYRRRAVTRVVDDLKVVPLSCIWDWKKSWKKYLMELMVIEGYLMVYPSLPRQESFSVHHQEIGEHFKALSGNKERKVVDYFHVPLASDLSAAGLIKEIGRMNLSSLPIFSFYHFPVKSVDQLKQFGRLVKAEQEKTPNKIK